MLIFPIIEDGYVFFNWRRGISLIPREKYLRLYLKPFDLIENLNKLVFTNSRLRFIKLPNNSLLEEQQFFTLSHIFLIIFSEIFYHFLSKMSALNKTKSQIWRQYMNLSLHVLSLSPNRH